MSEIEAAALGGIGGWFRRRKPAHTLPLGSPCPNCATPLQGPWCHECGQVAEDFHRSVTKLLLEAVEGFTHFDGRFWRTVPQLVWKPAAVTKAYIEGHRAVQIPPLRLFLVVLLMVFLVGSATGGKQFGAGLKAGGKSTPDRVVIGIGQGKAEPEERAKAEAELNKLNVTVGRKPNSKVTQWARERLKRALENPEAFKLVLEQWSERFAFMMLPIAAALLSLLFVFQRRFYVFDHTIFALHSLSFQGMLLAVLFVVGGLGNWTGLLLLAAPVHLFLHMRGVYGSSIPGTLLRMLLLGFGSLFGFVLLMLGLLWVGLNAMGG